MDPSGLIGENPDMYTACRQQTCGKETFPYGTSERQRVADYASSSSRANFEQYLKLRQESPNSFDYRKVSPTSVIYPITGKAGSSTGSALFISESLYYGAQLPMTKVWNTIINSSGNKYNPSSAWSNHPQLEDNFLIPKGARKLSIYNVKAGSNDLVFNENGRLNITDPSAFYGLISNLQGLQAGDYFLQGDPPEHGALVVGWGPLKDCGDVSVRENNGDPYQLLSGSNFNTSQVQSNPLGFQNILVPYVTDSNYAVRDDGSIRHLQDPRPRPFYCLKAKTSVTSGGINLSPSFFNLSTWTFLALPNSFSIPCSEQIGSALP